MAVLGSGVQYGRSPSAGSQLIWLPLMTPFIERLALWCCLGVVLGAGDITYNNWLFWCVIVLVMAIQWVSVRDGREDGAYLTLQLPLDEFAAIKRELEEIEK